MSTVDLSFSLIFAPFSLSLLLNQSNFFFCHVQGQIEWHIQILKVLKCPHPHFPSSWGKKHLVCTDNSTVIFSIPILFYFKQKYIIYSSRFKTGGIASVMRMLTHLFLGKKRRKHQFLINGEFRLEGLKCTLSGPCLCWLVSFYNVNSIHSRFSLIYF